MYNYSQNRVLLKPVIGDMAGVAYFITGHEQAEVNQVCYFHFSDVSLASKGSYYSELIFLFERTPICKPVLCDLAVR